MSEFKAAFNSMELWTKRSISAGLVSAVLCFLLVGLLKLGVSKELVILPIVVGVCVFLIVLVKNPDFWELCAAQVSFFTFLFSQCAYHLEIRLDDLDPVIGWVGSAFVKIGGSPLAAIILAGLSIMFTILFRKNHVLVGRTIIIPTDGLSNDVVAEIQAFILEKVKVSESEVRLHKAKRGSTKLPIDLPFKYAKRLDQAFYSGELTEVIISSTGKSYPVVDIAADDSAELRWLIYRWLGVPYAYSLHNDFDSSANAQDSLSGVIPINWIDAPASVRSFVNRTLAIACKSSCLELVAKNRQRRSIWNEGDPFGLSFLIVACSIGAYAIFSVDGMFEGASVAVQVTLVTVVYMFSFSRLVSSYAFRKPDFTLTAMAMLELRLVLKSGEVDHSSLQKLTLLEEQMDLQSSWVMDEIEFREAWATVVREFTQYLHPRMTNAPWKRLLSMPVYYRFDPSHSGELLEADLD